MLFYVFYSIKIYCYLNLKPIRVITIVCKINSSEMGWVYSKRSKIHKNNNQIRDNSS